jgi:hypothetical protein
VKYTDPTGFSSSVYDADEEAYYLKNGRYEDDSFWEDDDNWSFYYNESDNTLHAVAEEGATFNELSGILFGDEKYGEQLADHYGIVPEELPIGKDLDITIFVNLKGKEEKVIKPKNNSNDSDSGSDPEAPKPDYNRTAEYSGTGATEWLVGDDDEKNYYKEGVKLFNFFQPSYLFAEGVGVLGSFQVKGYTAIEIKNNRSLLKIWASGNTGAQHLGSVNFFGVAALMVNGSITEQKAFSLQKEDFWWDANNIPIGEVKFNLPKKGDVNLFIRINYSFEADDSVGIVSPTPFLEKKIIIYKE